MDCSYCPTPRPIKRSIIKWLYNCVEVFILHRDQHQDRFPFGSVLFYYHPPMKLWYGNVFSHVCLFTGERESHVIIKNGTLDLTVQAPLALSSPGYGTFTVQGPTPLASDITGDLFKVVQARTPIPHQCWHLVAVQTHTVSASGQYASDWNGFLSLCLARYREV